MSNATYVAMAATTLRLLTEYGVAVVVTRTVPGTFVPATGLSSASSELTTSTRVVSKAIKATDAWRIPSGKFSHVRLLTMAASGMDFAPEPGDSLPFEGSDWTVAPDGVRPINPDGETVIAYDVWVTR